MSRALFLIPVLALVGMQDAAKTEKPEVPAPEETHTVQRGDLSPTVEIESVFEAVEAAEIRLKLEGYSGELKIVKVVGHGETVQQGDVLLSIDPEPLQKQIAAAELEFKLARASFEKAQAAAAHKEEADALALRDAQTEVDDAAQALKLFDEVTGRHFLIRVDRGVQYVENYVSDQQEELDQLEKMYKSEDLTNATAEIVVRRARRALEQLKEYLKMEIEEAKILKEVEYPQARRGVVQALEKKNHELAGVKQGQAHAKLERDAEIEKAKTALVDSEEKTAKLRKDVAAFTVKSPLAGRAYYGPFKHGAWETAEELKNTMKTGEGAAAGQVLITVCGPTLAARADLPEEKYFEVTAGMTVSLEPAAQPDAKVGGRVGAKSLTATGKGGPFSVGIELAEQPKDLLPGMKSKTTVMCPELKGVVLVPVAAITANEKKSTVNVSKDDKTETREVKVGKSDGKMTEIKSGLEPGEKVVLPK